MLNRRFAPARLCKAATRQDERVGIMKHALVIGILVICLALAGCGPAATTSTSHSSADKGYGLAVSGLTLYCHDDMAPILAGLGEAKSYFEAASCAFPGLEKTYTYPSFNLYTYEDGDKDRLASIVILDDSISTQEGIYLNASLDDVIKAYGEPSEKSLNLYTYEKASMKLSFIIEDDKVTSIEYIAKANN